MRWSNEMFYILLFNSFAGAIAYGFWMIAKSGMAKKKKLKYVYPMLGIVEAFFIFPVMFVYLKVSTHVPGSHGSYYGTLFLQTPFIYMAECLMAGIWILGMIFYLGNYIKEYWKFKNILKKSFAYELPADVCSEISQELEMKRKVTLYQNYAVTSPIVVGCWNKKIIFPVQDYEERELVTILFHELVHIRQHILEMKKIGIFLKLIFWCNPMMNSLLRNIDEWGEIACDRYVCYETAYPYTVKEYYTVAVDGMEQSHIWMPQMVTGFKKKSNFKRRLLQMKNYRKESILAPFFKFLEVVFDLLVPVVIAQIIDVGITGNDRPYIIERFFILVLMAAAGLAVSITAQFFAAKASVGFATANPTSTSLTIFQVTSSAFLSG